MAEQGHSLVVRVPGLDQVEGAVMALRDLPGIGEELAVLESLSLDALPPPPADPTNAVADDPLAAGLRLQLISGAARDGTTVVDDQDVVGEAVGLLEVEAHSRCAVDYEVVTVGHRGASRLVPAQLLARHVSLDRGDVDETAVVRPHFGIVMDERGHAVARIGQSLADFAAQQAGRSGDENIHEMCAEPM